MLAFAIVVIATPVNRSIKPQIRQRCSIRTCQRPEKAARHRHCQTSVARDAPQGLKDHSAVVKSDHPTIDALGVQLYSDDVLELETQDWVLDIATDAIAAATHRRTQSILRSPRRRRFVKPLDCHTPRAAPTGVTVAIIDSGIALTADSSGRITGFWDLTKGGIATTPFDDYGHGTHVGHQRRGDNIVWATADDSDNIVWSTNGRGY